MANECSLCKERFGSLAGFDRHHRRVKGAVICLPPPSVGLHQDMRGVWRDPPDAKGNPWAKQATEPEGE